ncbi:MAG: VWA domain-containing protein, partial [Proteobacteria bacterium]|nr:VWA domain-containing protein [Pseudomonadota bacterium]
MKFFGPIGGTTFMWIAIASAALVVSAYIIKMRRRRFEVPFAQLWKRVLQEKDANALWKHLKRILSLLFILAILGIVLFASLDPTLGAVDRDARNVVILLDASGSMKAMDGNEKGDKSRLEAAKDAADKLVDSMGGGDLAMIMKVDGQATPASRFSADIPMLRKQIPVMLATRAKLLSRSVRRNSPSMERRVVNKFLFGEPLRLRDAGLVVDQLICCPPATM